MAAIERDDAGAAAGDGRGVRLILPSEVRYLTLVSALAEEFAREMRFGRDAVESVAISVVEASTNAIQHGNGYDASKQVEVVFERDGDRMMVSVRDEGPGFDPEAVADPLAPENLLRESGRGIFLCRRFMDEVDFGRAPRGGAEIRLVKRLTAGNMARDDE